MRRFVIIATVLAATTGAALADSPAIGERQALLKQMGKAVQPVARMLRGEAEFDLPTVKTALKTIETNAAKLPSLFPDDSKTGDTKALPAIWEEKDKFNAIYAKLESDAKAADASIADLASLKADMPKVLGNCGACHQAYRAK